MKKLTYTFGISGSVKKFTILKKNSITWNVFLRKLFKFVLDVVLIKAHVDTP